MNFFNIKKIYTVSIPGSIPGVFLLFSVFLLTLSGCIASNQKEIQDNAIEQRLNEKRIENLEKKLDKIYSRLSIIQFMVDSHEQILQSGSSSSANTTPNSQKTDLNTYSDDTKPVTSTQKKPQNLVKKEIDQEAKKLSPEQLYSKGIQLLNQKNYDMAVNIFNNFLDQYKSHSLADNALYWKGEAYYTRKNFKKSASLFEQVTIDYPQGSKYPDALLKAAYAHVELGNNTKAKDLLQKVIKLYPFSNAAPKAEAKLKEIL